MKSPINVYSNSGGGWEYVISRLQWSAFLSRTEERNENNGWRKTKNPEHYLNHSLRLEGEKLNVNALQPSYIIKCQDAGSRIQNSTFQGEMHHCLRHSFASCRPMDYQCSEATTEPHAETHIPTYKSTDRWKWQSHTEKQHTQVDTSIHDFEGLRHLRGQKSWK